MNKKLLSMAFAVAMLASMSTTAFASRGYPSSHHKVRNTAITEVTKNAITKITKNEINNAVSDALKNTAKNTADETSSVAKVKLENAKEITAETIRNVADVASSNGVKAVIQADKIEGDKVIARLYIDPAKATNLKQPVKLDVETDNGITRFIFERHFENNIAIVKFAQEETFGMDVSVAIKLDLSKIDTTKELYFYSYNVKTNIYTKVTATNYSIDQNGYIHFTTHKAGDMIISDSPLVVKE